MPTEILNGMDRKEIQPRMKTIGVIGGLGPQATMDFERRVHEVSQQLIPSYQNRGYPPMVVYYMRHAPLLFEDDRPVLPLRADPELLDTAAFLAQRSDFLVITSNTPHFFQSEVESASAKKVLSMVDVTLEEVKNRNLQKVGIIAIGHTLKNGLYQNPLDQHQIAWETIPEELAERLDQSLFEVMEGRETDESRRPAEEAVEHLREKGVDGIILGCTEAAFLLDESSDLINPIQLLAEAAVKEAMKQ